VQRQSPGAEFLPYHQGNESLPARVPASAFPVSETFSSDSDQYPESNRPAKPQGLVHCAVSSLSRPPTSPLFSGSFGRETEETFNIHTNISYFLGFHSITYSHPPQIPRHPRANS
jgi:hypothetical protein